VRVVPDKRPARGLSLRRFKFAGRYSAVHPRRHDVDRLRQKLSVKLQSGFDGSSGGLGIFLKNVSKVVNMFNQVVTIVYNKFV
jgi:hypothetical protein